MKRNNSVKEELFNGSRRIRISMQHFAEPAGGDGGGEPAPEGQSDVPKPDTNPDTKSGHPDKDKISDDDLDKRIEKLVQARSDRLNAESGKTIAELRREIDKLKKASMTAEEIKDLEIKEKENTIAEREKALAERENRLTAVNALKEFGLDDGTLESNELLPLIMANDAETIKSKAKALGAFAQKCRDAATKKFFNGDRHIPPLGGDTPAANPKLDAVKQLGEEAGKRAERSKAIRDNFLNRK